MNTIATFLTGIVVTIGSFFGLFPVDVTQPVAEIPAQEEVQVGTTKPAALFTYYLGGGGISSSATSFTLTSFTLPQNNTYIQDSDLSDTFYLTLEPGNTTRQEIISCTTVGTNTGGNVTISGCTRGLSPLSPYTASTSLAFSHAGGAAVILSDPPQLFEQYGALANDETITGAWSATTPTAANGIATKSYVDGIVSGGSVSLDSISVAATAGETFATGTIVYFDPTQTEWMKASAATIASSTNIQLGIAQGNGTNGMSINGGVLTRGYDITQSGMTAGQTIYLSDTAGATSTSAGTYSVILGQARSTTQLYFDPIYGNIVHVSADNTLTGNNTFSGSTTTFSGATTTFSGTYVDFSGVTDITGHASTTFTVYTASTTWSKPAGLEYIEVWVCAGGGGSGGSDTDNANITGGGGGGACAYEVLDKNELSATTSVAIVVGVAGQGTTAGGVPSPGTDGGTSSFGNFLSATGGSGSVGSLNGTTGGAGGTATGGDLNINGQAGGNGAQAYLGSGGNSVFGFGGPMAGSSVAATGYGGGGKGATASGNGNNGTQGFVSIKAHF